MPPKRKRGGAAGKGRGGKKAKTADESDQPEPEAPVPAKATRGRGRGRSGKNAAANSVPAEPEPEAPTITKQIIENLKKTDNKKRTAKVDQYCRLSRLAATVGLYDALFSLSLYIFCQYVCLWLSFFLPDH